MSSTHRTARTFAPLSCANGCGRNASPVSAFCVPCGAALDAIILADDAAANEAWSRSTKRPDDCGGFENDEPAENDDGREEPFALVGVLHVPGRRCATCNGMGEVHRAPSRHNPTGLEDCPDPSCNAGSL